MHSLSKSNHIGAANSPEPAISARFEGQCRLSKWNAQKRTAPAAICRGGGFVRRGSGIRQPMRTIGGRAQLVW